MNTQKILDNSTLQDFKEWADGLDPNRTFEYSDTKACVGASFLKEHFKIDVLVYGVWNFHNGFDAYKLPEWLVKTVRSIHFGSRDSSKIKVKTIRRGAAGKRIINWNFFLAGLFLSLFLIMSLLGLIFG